MLEHTLNLLCLPQQAIPLNKFKFRNFSQNRNIKQETLSKGYKLISKLLVFFFDSQF